MPRRHPTTFGSMPFDPRQHQVIIEDITNATMTCTCGKKWKMNAHFAAIEAAKADEQVREFVGRKP